MENEGRRRALRDKGGDALVADVYCIYKDRMTHFVSNASSALFDLIKMPVLRCTGTNLLNICYV